MTAAEQNQNGQQRRTTPKEVTGRLAEDPTLRFTQTGKAVASFGLLENHYSTGGDGKPVQSDTTRWNVTAWEGLGEKAGDTLHKGHLVTVKGVHGPDQGYERKDGSQGVREHNLTAREIDVPLQEVEKLSPSRSQQQEQTQAQAITQGL